MNKTNPRIIKEKKALSVSTFVFCEWNITSLSPVPRLFCLDESRVKYSRLKRKFSRVQMECNSTLTSTLRLLSWGKPRNIYLHDVYVIVCLCKWNMTAFASSSHRDTNKTPSKSSFPCLYYLTHSLLSSRGPRGHVMSCFVRHESCGTDAQHMFREIRKCGRCRRPDNKDLFGATSTAGSIETANSKFRGLSRPVIYCYCFTSC